MVALPLDVARRNLARLRSEAGEVVKRAREIAERAASGEEPSAEAEREFLHLERRAKQYESDIRLAESDVQAAEYEAAQADAFNAAERNIGKASLNMSINTEARYGVPLPAGRRFADLPDANTKASFEDFGNYTRALLLGESRANYEGDNASGGYLVPLKYGSPVLDLAVNEMRVRQAGARIVPMDSKSVQIARLEQDPQPSWRAENAAIAESAGVFGAVTLTARSLAVHVRISLELLEDSSENFGNVIGSSLARAFALEADRVALYGTGTGNQPRGVKNTSGVNIENYVGENGYEITGAMNGGYGGFIAAVGRLKSRNYTPTGLIYSPRTEMSFGALTDTTNQPLSMPEYLKEIPHFVTGQVPDDLTVGTSDDTSDFFAADWSNLVIGVRTQFKVLPINELFLVSNGQIGLAGWLRTDVQVIRPDAFEVLVGLRS